MSNTTKKEIEIHTEEKTTEWLKKMAIANSISGEMVLLPSSAEARVRVFFVNSWNPTRQSDLLRVGPCSSGSRWDLRDVALIGGRFYEHL